jgi:hypothetical protein
MSGSMDGYWGRFYDLDAIEHRHWKEWMEIVFIPKNERICLIIAENSHLVNADTYPNKFGLLNRHVGGWRAVMGD